MDNSNAEKESVNFNFGANLLRLREKKTLTQDQLGEMIGVSGAQIGKYESNENMPRQEKVWKLSKALGVSEAELRGLNVKENITLVPESRLIPVSEEAYGIAMKSMARALDTMDNQFKAALARAESAESELKKLKGE